ncbi:MAG: WbqC-like protein [Moraxellaceae bacterium]|jgi:hypothetical protein|nr:WbqC-like protein [Moraxellaceae bacterium]
MNVVISQPFFFPWVGMLEQVRLADVFVHYADVQFSKGSFTNRVQVKTANGVIWMTVPLEHVTLGQKIAEVGIDNRRNWQRQHLETLKQAYARAPFRADMLALVEAVYAEKPATIGALSERSLMALCEYFGLDRGRRFLHSDGIGADSASSRRVLAIVQALQGDRYITGWGARNYLEHELFEQAGIRVEYMNYRRLPYPQLHGEFTPFVSALDLVANTGSDGRRYIASETIYWKDFEPS